MSEIAKLYDAWSKIYDANHNKTRDLDAAVLRAAPISWEGRAVLEVGCGTGKNTEWLVERAASVLGLDFSEGMLAKARERAPRARFAKHDVRERWPVDDASVDAVVANLVLEHLVDVSFVFAEAARVLRSGGIVFSCELHPFRQLGGSGARFVDPTTGEERPVTAFPHDVSEYLNAGCRAGLVLLVSGDWRDAPGEAPRLFSTLWKKF